MASSMKARYLFVSLPSEGLTYFASSYESSTVAPPGIFSSISRTVFRRAGESLLISTENWL
jgi:hypothetical protein